MRHLGPNGCECLLDGVNYLLYLCAMRGACMRARGLICPIVRWAYGVAWFNGLHLFVGLHVSVCACVCVRANVWECSVRLSERINQLTNTSVHLNDPTHSMRHQLITINQPTSHTWVVVPDAVAVFSLCSLKCCVGCVFAVAFVVIVDIVIVWGVDPLLTSTWLLVSRPKVPHHLDSSLQQR